MSLKSLQLIQQFWWDDRYDLEKVTVFYVDRGAPNDVSKVNGLDLIEPESKFYFGIRCLDQTKCVPYHRIYRIEYDGKCLFERSLASAVDLNNVLGVDYMTDQKAKRCGK